MKLRVTATDFSEDGLTIMTPSDRRFDSELSSLLKVNEPELTRLIELAKPFCVFVRNETDLSVVGCSLEWNVLRTDGTILSKGQPYLTPGILTGLQPIDRAMIGRTELINPHSSAFVSLDPEVKQFFDAMTKSAGARRPLPPDDKEEIKKHSDYLRNVRQELLKSATAITVSIDGLVFSDGTFTGSDKYQLILNTKALVDAKRELAKRIDSSIKRNENTVELFRQLDLLAKNPTASLRSSPTMSSDLKDYERLYSGYMQITIGELFQIRDAQGSEEAIKYSQEAFHRPWPSLHQKKAS